MSRANYTYFAIFGAMRSGSNLLEQSLNQYAGIVCHGELFNPAFIGHSENMSLFGLSLADREKSPDALVEAMIDNAGTEIAGLRIFQNHDPRAIEFMLENPDCGKIILQRDPLQSYVSLAIARQTDQWLLTNAPERRGGKIHFDEHVFSDYRDAQADYYTNIRKTLRETGQSALWVDYPEQTEIATLNGIAKFLGSREKLKKVQVKIRRQNPGGLEEKVDNYSDMISFLGQRSETDNALETILDPARRANIPKMTTCNNNPVLFAPIPGGPNDAVINWMRTIDGSEPTTGHNQRTLFTWMQEHPNMTTISAVSHPVSRAYDVFMTKIFITSEDSYRVIRNKLINHFGLDIPEMGLSKTYTRDALLASGYGIGQHRAAFHTFLRFLKSNLDGQTSIRIDELWATQASILAAFSSVIPIALIAKDSELVNAFSYVEGKLNILNPTINSSENQPYLFNLKEVYTQQTENLTRKVYGVDYTRLGFGDYQAALDV